MAVHTPRLRIEKNLTPDPGPMGLRCLHPIDPIPVPKYVPRSYGYMTAEMWALEYARCAFDDCVCVCHENPLTPRNPQDHAYQQKPGRAPDGSFYEFCGICGTSPAWHR